MSVGSPTTYPKAGQCSKHAEKDLITHRGSWPNGTVGGTSYPSKRHQRQNNHKIMVKGMEGGSGGPSPDSYPMRQWQRKFGANKRQT